MVKIRVDVIKIDFFFHCIELKIMSARNMPPIPPIIYRRMSIRGEMSVHIHNAAVRKFNTFYKQPLHLGTIPETPESQIGLNQLSSNLEAPIITVNDVMLSSNTH